MRFRPNSAFFLSTPTTCRPGGRRSGYTLVEILVALTLTLILMTAVVTVFAGVGEGIAKSRRALEQFDRLRTAAQQLRSDLRGVTVTLDGRPTRPEENRGYFEYIEGGILGTPSAVNDQLSGNPADSTVGQRGDILMFTTRNATAPFQGRYALSPDPLNPTLQSDVAEVAWFLRGTTLHRRVLLVAPGVAQNAGFAALSLSSSTFFQNNDISARLVNGKVVPNSLGDLTKRENRFAHPTSAFPFDARAWGLLGLPTLAECSSPTWMAAWVSGTTPPPPNTLPSMSQNIDYWDASGSNLSVPYAFFGTTTSGTLSTDQYSNYKYNGGTQDGTRLADDVVLTNVIGFDVKVWEPAPNAPNNGAAGYVDLGYSSSSPIQLANYTFPTGPTVQRFQHLGIYALSTTPNYQYSLVANAQTFLQRVYDSGCFSYENEGIYHYDQNGRVVQPPDVAGGQSTNGLDDGQSGQLGNGIVDDLSESITCSPYPVPLRGIQITIRCFEPDSRQVRQITIEQDFLPR